LKGFLTSQKPIHRISESKQSFQTRKRMILNSDGNSSASIFCWYISDMSARVSPGAAGKS
jgi:hypothetical protein